jgi:hypothetical protein
MISGISSPTQYVIESPIPYSVDPNVDYAPPSIPSGTLLFGEDTVVFGTDEVEF